MSTISGIAAHWLGAGAIVRAIGGALARWWRAYITWRIEQWTIARLREMSDRQLEDIGLARCQIEPAVRGAIVRGPRRP
jgi:uncharacterized protein YjiS (DUF1127 family)